MAADSMDSARRTPLIAAVPKMLFPAIVILPGLIALALPKETPDGKGLIPVKIEEATGEPKLDSEGKPELDYDLAIPRMLLHYFPTGMLGIGLTALLASFMSGMAGNVTAFNTVWTFDIYAAYIKRNAGDRHYLWMGHLATLFGILISVGAAYVVTRFNNIMDLLQLVFGIVNAPLFATFLLGMFWKRATGHGAFFGLLAGTLTAALHHGLTLSKGAAVGIKGGWLSGGDVLHTYPSEMAQNFWAAIFAWTVCFVVTILVSLATRPREERELVGLVYSLTERPSEAHMAWYKRPVALGVVVLILAVILNVIFW
jgi:SSS family solute:Na+ symporter